MATKRASIDIGSNSTLLLILDIDNKEIIEEHSKITSLGKDLDKNGEFLENSMAQTYEALKEYLEICKKHSISPEDVVMTGTEASRVASNAKSFYRRVHDNLHLSIKLITGEGEAYYTAFGISEMANIKEDEIVIMDVGGASSELILLQKSPFKIISSVSIPVGSVRTTDWIEQGSMNKEFSKAFKEVDLSVYKEKTVICVAGTLTTVAAMMSECKEFNRNIINNYSTDLLGMKKYIEKISEKSTEDLENEFNYLGKRAPSIVGGGKCSVHILEKIEAANLLFSTYGLRYGTAIQGKINGNYII